MKQRNGFVSNSSSSSFVVAVRQGKPCRHCGRSDPDFLGLLGADDYGCSENSLEHEGLEDVRAYMLELLDDYELTPNSDPEKMDEWDRRVWDAYQLLQTEDWTEWKLAVACLDQNQSEMWERMLEQAEKGGTMKVLYGSF